MEYYPTIAAAIKHFCNSTLFSNKVIREAQRSLAYNENIAAAVTCIIKNNSIMNSNEKETGIFVVTDQRVFAMSSFMGKRTFQEILIKDIRNIVSNRLFWDYSVYGNIVTIDVKFYSGKNVISIDNAINEMRRIASKTSNNAQPVTNQFQNASSAVPYARPAHTVPEQKPDYSELKELKELLDADIITKEEFEAKKKQILNL